jgi:hypothetical protein
MSLTKSVPYAIYAQRISSPMTALDLKIILGQLSFLVGESLGPRQETCAQFRVNEEQQRKDAA